MVGFEHVMSNNMWATRVFICMPASHAAGDAASVCQSAMLLVMQLVYVSLSVHVSVCAKTENCWSENEVVVTW